VLRIASFHRRERGFSDYLRYALPLGDGVVRLKGNGFLVCFAYRGPDLTTSSWEELGTRADRLASMLRQLDEQWSVNVDTFRVPARDYPTKGYWPDRLTWLLDRDRQVRYEAEDAHYESRFIMTLAFYPRRQKQRAIARLLYDMPQLEVGSDDAAEAQFRTVIEEIGSVGRSIFPYFERLGYLPTVNRLGMRVIYDETLSFLSYCIRGRTQPIALLEDEPMLLDGVLAADDVHVDIEPRIGEKWLSVLCLDAFPPASYPGILDALNEQPLQYRFSQRFIPMSKREADDRLGWIAKSWGLASLNGLALITGGAAGGYDGDAVKVGYKLQAQEAQARAKQGLMYGHYLSQVVLHADSREQRDEAVEKLTRAIEGVDGFTVRVERENVMEAFIASLPGERDASEYREARMSIRNIGHLFPLTATWAGPVTHPNRRFPKDSDPLLYTTTVGNTPFRLEPHVRGNGHFAIFGGTDRGKSVLLMRLLSAFLARYQGAKGFLFDVGFSAEKYTLGAGGRHYNISMDDPPTLAPLVGPREAVIEWLLKTCDENSLTAKQKKELRDAYDVLLKTKSTPRITDLLVAVQDEGLRDRLSAYSGTFLDAERDDLDFAALQARGHTPLFVFEYEGLARDATRFTGPFVRYVQRRIWESLNDESTTPAIIGFDEFQKALSIDDLEAMSEDLVRTARKKLGQFAFATQDIEEVVNLRVGRVISNLVATKIFLPDPGATSPARAKLYAELGVKPEAIRVISRLAPFTYYMQNEYGSRVFSLEMSAFELAFLGGAGPDDRALVHRCVREAGLASWPALYMRRLNDPDLEPYIHAYNNVEGVLFEGERTA
jgi:type IV secretion system protein VirB4